MYSLLHDHVHVLIYVNVHVQYKYGLYMYTYVTQAAMTIWRRIALWTLALSGTVWRVTTSQCGGYYNHITVWRVL